MNDDEVAEKIKYLIDNAARLEKKLNENIIGSKLHILEDVGSNAE
jgi:hypothetical protein